jgi:peptide/nickel transport system substrate-binding protein
VRRFSDFGTYFDAFYSPATSADVAPIAWFADFPAPSNWFRGVFSCTPYFCDRAFERRLRRAVAVQARDPRAAMELWARLDREIVDRAVAIPLLNVKNVEFVSRRVGNYQRHPVFGTLVSQLWVR